MLQKMMTKKAFDGLAEHAKVHNEFVATIKGLKVPLDDDTVDFAKKW